MLKVTIKIDTQQTALERHEPSPSPESQLEGAFASDVETISNASSNSSIDTVWSIFTTSTITTCDTAARLLDKNHNFIDVASICARLPPELKLHILRQAPPTYKLIPILTKYTKDNYTYTSRLNVVHPALIDLHSVSNPSIRTTRPFSTCVWLPDTPFHSLTNRIANLPQTIPKECLASTHLSFLTTARGVPGFGGASIASAICQRTRFMFSNEQDIVDFLHRCDWNGIGLNHERVAHIGLRIEGFKRGSRFLEFVLTWLEKGIPGQRVSFLKGLKSVEICLRGTNLKGNRKETDKWLRIRWLTTIAYRMKLARGVEVSWRGTTLNPDHERAMLCPAWRHTCGGVCGRDDEAHCKPWFDESTKGWGIKEEEIWKKLGFEERDSNLRFHEDEIGLDNDGYMWSSCWMYEWQVVVRKELEKALANPRRYAFVGRRDRR